jgi:hypothetical protein
MVKKFSQVYQFHIALAGIKPMIWRRIQVPDTYSFWDFHVAIQDAIFLIPFYGGKWQFKILHRQ